MISAEMTSALDYLEAARTEEIASQLASEGYRVMRGAKSRKGTVIYDLVAERGDNKIVFEVKARDRLKQASDQIRQSRRMAHEEGYSDFRLVLVNPPHEVSVEIEGFAAQLVGYLNENMPGELSELSSNTRLEDISYLEFNSVSMSGEGILVRGTGVVHVELVYGGGEDRKEMGSREGFPFTFDILLNRTMQIETVHRLQVDTSSFS